MRPWSLGLLLAVAGCHTGTRLEIGGDDDDDSVDEDADDDHDGWTADVDCDDQTPTIHPGVDEDCNEVDDDCDGEVDEGVLVEVWADGDGDGWGVGEAAWACEPAAGQAAADGDCDDADVAVHPQAEDACDDAIDSDCDPRDLQCTVGGDYLSSESDATVFSTSVNDYMGEYQDVGDLNGDGLDDVAMTTFYRNNYAGGAALVFGSVTGEHTVEEVGARLESTYATTSAGRAIAVGDLDDDGVDDVVVGAPDDTCQVWVSFGPFSEGRALADAGVLRTGRAGTEVGHGLDVADVSGDGIDDLVVGAYEYDTAGRQAGSVFVELGPIAMGTANVADVASATLNGESRGAYAGRYVRVGGDVDGDGVGDLLIAAPYASDGAAQSGVAYLVYGGALTDLDLEEADARYIGEAYGDYAGEGLAMGDVTGDGLDDVLLGSFSSRGGSYAGAAYVVAGPGTAVRDLADADLVLRGERPSQQFGLALSGDDLDGDGVGELIVGARGDSTVASSGGAAYLYWGPVTAGAGPGDADASFLGDASGAQLGYSVGLGDLDGDGTGDVLLGAPTSARGAVSAGALHVFYTGD